MRRYVWLVGVVVMLLVSGCQGGFDPQEQLVVDTQPEKETAATPLPTVPAQQVILMDGELVAASPSLKVSFPGNVSAELLALHVQVGQRVARGDLIAILDDDALVQALADAQLTLDRATEDRDKAVADSDDRYQRQVDDAQAKYERELREAQRTLEAAESALQRAEMQPPTLALAEAKSNLARALEEEAQAHDEYLQALDRPWEPQRIRDSLYKDWQRTIEDRKMAELRLQDAETSLQVYYFDLEQKKRDVENAQADLARVEKDEVEREDTLSYERTIEDAERVLADAEKALGDARLYAPFDGLVISIDANVGAEVTSGTPIAELVDLEQLHFVTSNLSERHVAQLRPGQQANITLRTYPDVILTGHVDSVVPQTPQTPNAEARFAAYIRPDKTDLDLLPGMTGRVEIVTEAETAE